MFPLARSLLLADAVTSEAMARALLVSATNGTSLVSALLATGAIDASRLEQHLERGDAPTMRHVAPVLALVQRLPQRLCERLLALPVRSDPRTGTVDVAVVDATDPHPVQEIARCLDAPVRMVRTSLAAFDAALQRASPAASEEGLRALAAPMWMPALGGPRGIAHTPPYGSPAHRAEAVEKSTSHPARSEGVEPGADPNIPFALTRSPVLELTRPKAPFRAADAESLQPVTKRGPFADLGPPTAPASAPQDLASILGVIRETHDRDAILELVVAAACTVARRAAVLAVRRGSIVGWTCSSEFADRAALRTVQLTSARTALTPALRQDGVCLTRIPLDATHAPLLWVMNTPPAGEVALIAVRVEGRPVALLLADGLAENDVEGRHLEEIARVAGVAIADVLRHRPK